MRFFLVYPEFWVSTPLFISKKVAKRWMMEKGIVSGPLEYLG